MAITVAKHCYQDLNSLATEPLRGLQSFEYSLQDPMEFGIQTIDETISRNVYSTHDILPDYVDQSIAFVHNKDAWSADFAKCMLPEANLDTIQHDSGSSGGGAVVVQQLLMQPHQANRKRRMDWDPLVLQHSDGGGSGASSGDDCAVGNSSNGSSGGALNGGLIGPSDAKLAHLGVAGDINGHLGGNKQQQQQQHDQQGRKTNSAKTSSSSGSGRMGWTDDIDFDINSELANNSYLNNEAFLLSTALTILKHEIPSPSSEPQKGTQNLQQQQQQQKNVQDSAIVRDNVQQHQQAGTGDIAGISNGNSNSNSNDQLQHQQSMQQQLTLNVSNQQQPPQQQQQQQQQQPQHQLQSTAFKGLLADQGVALTSNGLDSHGNGGATVVEVASTKGDKPAGEQSKFQYVLAASTSIATKCNEDTLTYLNQGQSYEIKLKKLGDLSTYRGKILKSVIKICFHERRLQYMEREQMLQWQASRPGERIVEIDVPLSYGLCQVAQSASPQLLNTVEVLWDPMKEVGVYIQVNCISTEFTPKKHGGEKGVPFRIQVETYLDGSTGGGSKGVTGGILSGVFGGGNNGETGAPLQLIHAAACQIKVFKLKGADRKHKQDREKIQKRTITEKDKYQPSYECTILTDIPNETIAQQTCYSPEHVSLGGNNSPLFSSNSPVHVGNKFDIGMAFNGAGQQQQPQQQQQQQQQQQPQQHPIGINSVSSSNSNVIKQHQQQQQQQQTQQQHIIDQSSSQSLSPHRNVVEHSDESLQIATLGQDSSPAQLLQWLNHHRLGQHAATFAHFSGADLLRMSKDDIIQICGVADGIRMYNTIHSKAITPRLTIYVSFDGTLYHAVYLHANTTLELSQKLCKLPGFHEFANGSGLRVAGVNGVNGVNGNSNGANGTDANVFSTWCHPNAKYAGNSPSSNDTARLAVYVHGPAGIQVLVTDEVLGNIKEDALFAVEFQAAGVLMKAVYKNDATN